MDTRPLGDMRPPGVPCSRSAPKGKAIKFPQTETSVNDSSLVERGFVARIHNGVNYFQYSFNEINEDMIETIVKDIKDNLNKVRQKYVFIFL